ncbi:TIGR02117 family protein [Sphingobacterium prati]|uniref:TIGR02117 family protein n=1 Tax=Sphingobacterium prati TaxID=2737006 RepID=UPI0015535892|nr:TIGR02117 family protein [Sphingobacterium prati]NPE48945.1 TIGR02117 family protein [Sphingobacterium prati]
MKKILQVLGYIILGIISFCILYIVAEYSLSRLSASRKEAPENRTIQVFVKSNGVHTDIVLPVVVKEMDWSVLFPYANTVGKKANYRYMGIGWGDKGFYLDTPEWKDLKASTAFVAAFGLGESAMHVTYYNTIEEDDLCFEYKINEEQYRALVKYIYDSLDLREGKPILVETDAQYDDADAFYEAKGSYSMFYSCNTWTNNALKKADMPAGVWATLDKGILSHYRK